MKLLRGFFVSLRQGFGLVRALAPIRQLLKKAWSIGPLRLLILGGAALMSAFLTLARGIRALDLRLFFQGLPALAAAGAAIAVAVMVLGTPAQELEIRYTEHAKAASKAKNYPEALACYERLAQMQGDPPEIIYEMARVAADAGNYDRCLALMQQLASPDKPGYPNAHVWHAFRLMLNPGDGRMNRQQAESHLLLALDGSPDDKEAAHGLLGELYLARGTLPLAETHLLIAVKTKPQARLRLAHLYWVKGNRAQARVEAQNAVNIFAAAAKEMSAQRARLKWSEGLVFLEDFEQAVAVLREGFSGTNDPIYPKALAGVYLAWFDFLTRTGNPNPGLRMLILGRGLEADPKNVTLLHRLLGVTGIQGTEVFRSPGAIASTIGWGTAMSGPSLASAFFLANRSQFDEGQDQLRQILADGMPTAEIHFVLGTVAFENGDHKTAQVHWEAAMKMSPQTPVIANNLAWLIYRTEPTKLAKALEMANYAVKSAPQNKNFLDTRGRILLKMATITPPPADADAKLKQALVDLEAALLQSPNGEDLHRALAEVYERLGVESMAREHRIRADLLTDKKDKK